MITLLESSNAARLSRSQKQGPIARARSRVLELAHAGRDEFVITMT